jgi:hypothetical protein
MLARSRQELLFIKRLGPHRTERVAQDEKPVAKGCQSLGCSLLHSFGITETLSSYGREGWQHDAKCVTWKLLSFTNSSPKPTKPERSPDGGRASQADNGTGH